jgi:3-hydroxyacyl-CoA dehydrogenase/enoyl-CoA hydratase/3-hydroxybutyryl-CoA epimerase
VVSRQAREQTLKKSGGHYPALLAAIDAVSAGYSANSEESGYAEEARLFGEMAMTPVCKQLMFLFYATTALKKDSGVAEGVKALDVPRIGVLGTGFMGAGIAAVSVMQGVPAVRTPRPSCRQGRRRRARGAHDNSSTPHHRQQFDDQVGLSPEP